MNSRLREDEKGEKNETISSPWDLLHNSSWVSSLSIFFFIGVLAGYVEYQSSSLREN